jgi:hypothetical protein
MPFGLISAARASAPFIARAGRFLGSLFKSPTAPATQYARRLLQFVPPGVRRATRVGAGVVGAGAGFELGARGLRGLLGEEENGAAPRRRINPMNPRAARRAIARIKSVRKILQRIERQMPRRPCRCKVARRKAC